MSAPTATPIKPPKEALLRRATSRDLEVWAELNAVLNQNRMWMFEPPVWSNGKTGGLVCYVQGLAFTATSTPAVFAIKPYGYKLNGVKQKKLRAAQEALDAASYTTTLEGEWLLVRVTKAA